MRNWMGSEKVQILCQYQTDLPTPKQTPRSKVFFIDFFFIMNNSQWFFLLSGIPTTVSRYWFKPERKHGLATGRHDL